MSAVKPDRSREIDEAAREADWHHPGFARELFLGHFALHLISSAPQPSEEERNRGDAFLQRLEAFLRREVDPLQIERDARIAEHLIRGVAELGAFGMNIPGEYGGLGLSQVYTTGLCSAPPQRTRLSPPCSAPINPSVFLNHCCFRD